jgi:type II secretory pathway pseudopilin PulG
MSGSQHNPMDVVLQQLQQLQQQLQQQQAALDAYRQQQPQIPMAPAPRVKPERPPSYSGKRSESLETWIFQVEQFCELAQVPDEDRIRIAAGFLQDQAALWWRDYYRSIDWVNNAPTWAAFILVARAHFNPVNTTVSAYDRLQRLSQKTSVNTYNHEFRGIMLELPDMDAATRMNYYIRGLKEHLRPFVVMQTPATLIEAENIAERVDATTYKPRTQGTGFRPNRGYQAPGGTTPMELDAITKLDTAERERLRRTGGCFRCRKPGHLARDCTLPNRQNPRINAIETTTEPSEEAGKD